MKPSAGRVSVLQGERWVGGGGEMQGRAAKRMRELDWTGLTDARGAHASGDLLAQGLAEGDVTFFEHALEELASRLVKRRDVRMRCRKRTYDAVELGGPRLGHVCGSCLMEMSVLFVLAGYWSKMWLFWKGTRQIPWLGCWG